MCVAASSSLLLFSDEGLPLEVEKFLRQSLKCFPHTHSLLLKQMVATLSEIPLVREIVDGVLNLIIILITGPVTKYSFCVLDICIGKYCRT